MKLSAVVFWLWPQAVFWLVPYLSQLCQHVGGLESVIQYFDRNLKNYPVIFFSDFFSLFTFLSFFLSTLSRRSTREDNFKDNKVLNKLNSAFL